MITRGLRDRLYRIKRRNHIQGLRYYTNLGSISETRWKWDGQFTKIRGKGASTQQDFDTEFSVSKQGLDTLYAT